ncbi:MAG: nitroreductase [Bacteroidota bacterium]
MATNKYLCRMSNFENIHAVIQNRRSTKPADMNGKKIDDNLIKQLLHLADWAPTHARTEPWRFVVFSDGAVQQFCADHAELYKANTPEDKFATAKYEGLIHTADKASHIIAAYMKRIPEAKIPVIEDIAAVAASIQNILLGAEAAGISVLWSTGGMTHQPAMKEYFGLGEEDKMMGLLYLGYTDEPARPGKRAVPLGDKVMWRC